MKRAVQIDDLYRLKTVSQPVYFKHKYFFCVNGMNVANNQYTSVIMSVDDQNNYHQWTSGHFDSFLTISDDVLYFLRRTKQGNQLMQLDWHQQTVKQITHGLPISNLCAAINGNWLAYQTIETNEVPKFKTTTFPPTRYIDKLVNRKDGLGWLPNRVKYRLELLNTNTKRTQTLLKQFEPFSLKAVSSDGNQIAYIQANHPEIKQDYDISRGVYVFNRKQLQIIFATQQVDQGIFQDVAFAPDNQKLLIIGNDNTHYNQTVNDLWLYDFNQQKLTNMTKKMDDVDVGYGGEMTTDLAQGARTHAGQWLDNHRYIFHAFHHGRSQIYLGDRNQITLIDDHHHDIYDFNVSDYKHLIMSISQPDLPNQLILLNLDSHNNQVVFNPNAKYEQTHAYVHTQAFQYQTFDDQTEDGWILIPTVNSNAKLPVILYVHGGPHATYGDTFFHEFQMLAGQGYAVVFVNPRGSTTYGQIFQDAVNGHYGEGDYQDVLAGLDAALQRFPQLDQDRTAIIGGSYGGFMVTWAIGHTDRFKTAIAQRPLTDWQSMYTTSDIGNRYVREEMQKDLFKDADARDMYWKHSPLAYAMHVKTPVRILHGEWDMRCPTNQSEAFFNALQQKGVKSDYIRYPQSFHGISRNGLPSLRIKRLEDIVKWLNLHLK